MRKVVFSMLLMVISVGSFAQIRANSIYYEMQFYPAGWIPGVTLEFGNDKSQLFYHVRAGYNFTDRKDFSDFHDHEEGGGPGVSLGSRYYFAGNDRVGLFAGLRTDLWYMKINWEDYQPDTEIVTRSGSSQIMVFQPTIELGYFGVVNRGPVRLGIGISNGREINIYTKGEEVMQDWITLGNLYLSYDF